MNRCFHFGRTVALSDEDKHAAATEILYARVGVAGLPISLGSHLKVRGSLDQLSRESCDRTALYEFTEDLSKFVGCAKARDRAVRTRSSGAKRAHAPLARRFAHPALPVAKDVFEKRPR